MAKRTLEANDLYVLKSVADPQLSANGRDLLFIETTMDKEKNDYVSNLFYKDVEGDNPPVQWTFGTNRNYSPRWSPCGQQILFLSTRDSKPQLFLLHKEGGEARQLTHVQNGISNPIWSPDGKKIAFNVSLKKGEELQTKQEKKEEKPNQLEPLEVTKMKYKSDAAGFLDGKVKQVAIVTIETGECELVTSGHSDIHLQDWSPDGKVLAVTADLSENTDYTFLNDLYLLDLDSKDMKQVTSGTGYFGQATFSPDGKHIGLFGQEREFENATLTKLWLYQTDEDLLTCITADSDLLVGDAVVGDFHQGVVTPGVLWCENSDGFYFLASDHGNTVLYYGSVEGALFPALLDKQYIYGASTGGQLNKAVVAISQPTNPGDLYLLDVTTGEMKQLTTVNKTFLEEVELSQVEELEFSATDEWPLHGWLMKPANFNPNVKYPFVLEIHGGPHAMYANTYFNEFQLLAASGYVVLYINPRGSHGYGQSFVDAVRGDYGGMDYADLMQAVDYALDHYTFIDRDRLGVTGGSYGGFMTNWIVGHTNRFKAAVTQRSISNWISFYGVSDIGYYFNEWQIKAELNDLETLWKHSPLAYVDAVETPLLILHSEKDYRCPIEQAEQLFIALKHRRKETKFVRFPESNHELSRSGKPNLRIARLNYIVEWFNQYL